MTAVRRSAMLLVLVAFALPACRGYGEPGVGYARSLPFDEVLAGTVPLGEERSTASARAFVARTLDAAGGGVAGLPGATNAVEGIDFDDRALIAVLGGCQPDAGYRMELIAVVVGGGELGIVGRVVRDPDAAADDVLSVPWLLVTVDAGDLTVEDPLVLQLEGADRCAPDGA